jgi:P4 family phage/plasmid primase-like protien
MTVADLTTGSYRASDPLDYNTKITAVCAATPGVEAPLWLAFLDRVTQGNAELIGFLQRFLGYCLTGFVREHVLVFLYGTGGNGKGTFIDTVTGIMGDYAIVAPTDMFLVSRQDRHPTEIARLKGVRLVVAQETQKGRAWDEAKIKTLTGGDRLTGRFMRGDFFDFAPTHKFLLNGNHKPSLRTVDEAMRRRFLLVAAFLEALDKGDLGADREIAALAPLPPVRKKMGRQRELVVLGDARQTSELRRHRKTWARHGRRDRHPRLPVPTAPHLSRSVATTAQRCRRP